MLVGFCVPPPSAQGRGTGHMAGRTSAGRGCVCRLPCAPQRVTLDSVASRPPCLPASLPPRLPANAACACTRRGSIVAAQLDPDNADPVVKGYLDTANEKLNMPGIPGGQYP